MATQYQIYLAILAFCALVAGSAAGGWTVRGYKDAKEFKELQLAQSAANNKALTDAQTALKTKIEENAKIGQNYETRINDLLNQLKSKRVRITLKPHTGVPTASGASEPSAGSSAPTALADVEVTAGETSFTGEEATSFLHAAVNDGVRLEALQDYVNKVCLKESK